jgi:hypothetical protein
LHRLVLESEVPPDRLHDLRHGAASLAHRAGVDLKTVRAHVSQRRRAKPGKGDFRRIHLPM